MQSSLRNPLLEGGPGRSTFFPLVAGATTEEGSSFLGALFLPGYDLLRPLQPLARRFGSPEFPPAAPPCVGIAAFFFPNFL